MAIIQIEIMNSVPAKVESRYSENAYILSTSINDRISPLKPSLLVSQSVFTKHETFTSLQILKIRNDTFGQSTHVHGSFFAGDVPA